MRIPRPVQRFRMQHPRPAGREEPVQRQHRTPHRERGRGRAGEPLAQHGPQHGPREGRAAPGPPFVQVAAKDGRSRAPAEKKVLSERPHLGDAQHLRQRKMRAHDPQGTPVLADIEDDRAAMAMAGQIEKRHLLDLDPSARKEDHAEKAVAFVTPAPQSGHHGQCAGPCGPRYRPDRGYRDGGGRSSSASCSTRRSAGSAITSRNSTSAVRAGSITPSSPRPRWMFQLMIDRRVRALPLLAAGTCSRQPAPAGGRVKREDGRRPRREGATAPGPCH